jgi:hypothetical protein
MLAFLTSLISSLCNEAKDTPIPKCVFKFVLYTQHIINYEAAFKDLGALWKGVDFGFCLYYIAEQFFKI